MGELVSHVQKLAAERGWTDREFHGRAYAEGLSFETAVKLWNGDTNITTTTWQKLARVFDVSMGEVIEDRNGSHR